MTWLCQSHRRTEKKTPRPKLTSRFCFFPLRPNFLPWRAANKKALLPWPSIPPERRPPLEQNVANKQTRALSGTTPGCVAVRRGQRSPNSLVRSAQFAALSSKQQRAPVAASAPPPPRPWSSDAIARSRPTLAALTCADDDATSLPRRARSGELTSARSSLQRARLGKIALGSMPRRDRSGELAPARSPRQGARSGELASARSPQRACPGELALATIWGDLAPASTRPS